MTNEEKQKLIDALNGEAPVSITFMDGDKVIFRDPSDPSKREKFDGIKDVLKVISDWVVEKHEDTKTEGRSRTSLHLRTISIKRK